MPSLNLNKDSEANVLNTLDGSPQPQLTSLHDAQTI